jgi:hypothetical protein
VLFCTSCGKVIQSTFSFCPYCNNALSSINTSFKMSNNITEPANTYNLGVNLENFVEEILLIIGYIVIPKKEKKLKALVEFYMK